jgi:hypothetical protein
VALGTAQGIEASSSGRVAGLVVDHFGYSAAFAGAVAAVALTVLILGLPETAPGREVTSAADHQALREETAQC